MIEYRGQTVAFCNPGCRDKFGAATQMFDASINEKLSPALASTDVPAYQPRAMRFEQTLELGDFRLKAYHITVTPNSSVDATVNDNAIAFVRQHLPQKIASAGGAHGAGYVILHRGLSDHWLLMHWWAGGDMCLTSLARLQDGESEFESIDETHLHACVWEQVVVTHERDAWVRTMMTGQPDLNAYLDDRLADGAY